MTDRINRKKLGSNAFFPVGKVMGLVLLLNLGICLGKLLVGWSIHSLSMVADGLHSLMDALANGAGLAGLWVASKPADKDHPYGHQKFEILATLGIAVLMGVACVEVLSSALGHLGHPQDLPHPDLFSFLFMVMTMVVNGWTSWFESRKGRDFQSVFLTADSAHKGSDFLSSAVVLAALAGARLGWGWVDLAAAFLVAGVIAKAAWGILNQAQQVLVDHTMLDPAQVAFAVKSVPGVLSCHRVRSRGMPGKIFVDLHLYVSPRLTTVKAHALTHRVMEKVKRVFPGVREVFVHTEPSNSPETGV